MFNFGVVRTRNYDYEQQIPNITLHLQQLTTSAVRRRSA